MKKLFFVLLLGMLAAGFYVERIIDERAKAILRIIQQTEDEAMEMIFANISSASFHIPNIGELKNIALNERAAQVDVIGKYVKNYTTTVDFKNRYNEFRELQKPSEPEKPKQMAELQGEMKQKLLKEIEELKTTRAIVPAEQKAIIDENIKVLEDLLKETDKSDHPLNNPEMDNSAQIDYEKRLEQHQAKIAEWEAKHPVNNPNLFIKSWLNSFLERTNGIDYNAQTTVNNEGKTIFVNQEYERKNNLWKLCFRAGKETTESARKFAQSWIKELSK